MGDMQQRIEIKLETVKGVLLFNIHGDVTAFSKPYLREAYEDAKKQGASNILFKFEPTVYINSAGIESLLDLFIEMKQKNQQIGITGVSEHFKKIFKMVGISSLVGIYPSVDAAVESLSGS